METILLAVTAVSLLVALIMSAAAWRMSREERARGAARVAALATAASANDVPTDPIVATTASPERLTLRSRESGPVPVAIADELPLRPVLRAVDADMPRVPEAPRVQEVRQEATVPAGFLNSVEAPLESGGRQRGLMAAAAVLFVLLGTGAYWLISGNTSAEHSVSASAPAATAPLELISLRHERRASKLELSGLVRNPSAGAPVEGLNAVVFLFDAQGGFISSARVGVDFKRLAPGDESPFVITMDAPSNVARYRVSFRTDAGVVAHVDRRSEQPVATAIVR